MSKSKDVTAVAKPKSAQKAAKKVKSAKVSRSVAANTGSLLAADKSIDSALSSLFAEKPKTQRKEETTAPSTTPITTVSSVDAAVIQRQRKSPNTPATPAGEAASKVTDIAEQADERPARKRKRADAGDDLEERYMRKLEKEAEQEEEQRQQTEGVERASKKSRQGVNGANGTAEVVPRPGDEDEATSNDDADAASDGTAESWTPPKHETETATSNEVEKASRTVFLGNVSVLAITSKTSRKQLEQHLMSFHKTSDESPAAPRILESIRFRSTPYAPTLPKKAAFARKEVITATTQSSNAYAIYTTQAYARNAVRHLNGTVVLDRHLRVDSVAHPSPIEHRRCVFVGNLGFVDDESNIIAANDAEGKEKRKTKQKPSDVEEGLWRLFAKHGTVESVRVVRDKGTRVGKGIAYVQFTEENAVEGALSENDKKAPPMLPRRLRVTRAKAMRKKAAPPSRDEEKATGYRRKITPGEATQKGRIGKLMGKAAAAMSTAPNGFKSPESFVFEGHRAKSGQGKSGLKMGKAGKRKGKPMNRSTRRAATFRAGGGKK